MAACVWLTRDESSAPEPFTGVAQAPSTESQAMHGIPVITPSVVAPVATKNEALEIRLPANPAHSIADELVLVFPSVEQRQIFERDALARGWEIVAVNPSLNAIQLRFKGAAQRDAIVDYARRSGASIDWNYKADAPLPPVNYTVGQSGAFGPNAFSFIGAPSSEERARWGDGVTIAVLDNGVIASAELSNALKGETDLIGSKSRSSTKNNLLGHGTAVANLIGGERGLAPAASIYSYRVLNGDGVGDSFTVALGIVQATDNGADIISLSLGSRADTALLRQAVAYAQAHGVLLVAAAGNEGSSQHFYPAAYEGVVAVGGVDTAGQPAAFSNRGHHLALAAPAVGVQTAWTSSEDILFSGTSAAAPIISGAIAGLLSEDSTLTSAQAVQLLRDYANDTSAPGTDPQSGAGVIDLERVRNRHTPGIYDTALAGVWINPERSTDTALDVVVSVQNRGTERLGNVRLEVTTENQQTLHFPIGNLAPGATGSQSFTVPVNDAARGVRLQAKTFADSYEDSKPGNNQAALVLKPASKKPKTN